MDPWANIAADVQQRKLSYLNALVIPFTPGKPEEEALVTAMRRGYLKGKHSGFDGKRPTATPAEQAQANTDALNNYITWFDSPSLRSELYDTVGAEDVNIVNARLATTPISKTDPSSIPLPPDFVWEPPGLTDHVAPRVVLASCEHIGSNVLGDIRGILSAAKIFGDTPAGASSALIDLVMNSLGDLSVAAPSPSSADPPTLHAIKLLLPPDLADDVDAALRDKGGMDLSQEGKFVVGGGGLIGPGGPSDEVKKAADTLARLGRWGGMSLVEAMVDLADMLMPDSTPDRAHQKQRIRDNPFDFAVIHNRHAMPLPDGFAWPTWDHLGIYWWRAVLLRHCVEHVLSTKDTADFHATDLLRFAFRYRLFQGAPDPRVPGYVSATIKVSLLNFKYWYDQIADGRMGGHDWEHDKDVEMTFWSENHSILFPSAEFLAGQLWPDETFAYWDQNKAKKSAPGRDHQAWARVRLLTWLDHRLAFGFGEWRAPGYYNEDLPPLINLAEFAADDEVRTKAAMAVDLLLFDLARFTCGGSFGNTAGRAYWEVKAYGWGQSVGETVELLFGSRGDFLGAENTAIALATSDYEVPQVLLAIGRDRSVLDAAAPLTDRSRIGITFDEASKYKLDINEANIAFWWAAMAYYDHTLEVTKEVAARYGNLRNTPPFNTAFMLGDDAFHALLYDTLETTAGLVVGTAGVGLNILLPFPLNLLAVGLSVAGFEAALEGLWNVIGDVLSAVENLGKTILGIFGISDNDKPTIPESALQKALDGIITNFNKGSVLSRANIVTHSIGDAMLSSVQNHQVGAFSFQKNPWQATLDTDCCVWTTAPFTSTDFASMAAGWLELLKDLGQLRPVNAFADILLPLGPVNEQLAGMLGHNGPNYWTGSVSMPMVVQHERAAIIAYNFSNKQRAATDAVTHAWFPKNQFDETDQVDASGGTWTFGRRGQGFVALFSARPVRFTSDGTWKDKELKAEGSSNIWICHIGNQTAFAPPFQVPLSPQQAQAMQQPDYLPHKAFEIFKQETLGAYLNISGVGTWNQLEASFDVPRAAAPSGRSPRLELFHGDGKGRFAGDDMALDEFPRFENRYMADATFTFQPSSSGELSPQVQRPRTSQTVAWDSRAWTIRHDQTGLFLSHDLDAPSREFNRQASPAPGQVVPRRLVDSALTTVRVRPQSQRRAQWLRSKT
jgi:hypothetical protein